jgi:putative peptide maturation dehydrogenase
MTRVRRSAWLLFFSHDGEFIDVPQLLRGNVEPAPLRRLYALSFATGSEIAITRDELDVLLAVPSDTSVDGTAFDWEVVQRLVDVGLLVDEPDERLPDSGWNLYAAAYHFLTRWRGVDIRGADGDVAAPTADDVRAFLAVHGLPPSPFHPAAGPLAVVELPLVPAEGALYRSLAARRTTRSFDPAHPLPLEQLAIVVQQVFGAHGYAETDGGEIVTMKRTSPSAGGLHPIEAYPLVTNVVGLDAGLYHYDAERHVLELLERLEPGAAGALATQFVCGQTYFGSAHVLFLLAARFKRNYWKYRRHQKAYASILLDAGHLSQTLYLVATELGLGAFVTTVINNAEIDERLGVDGIDEGTVAVCGLGVSAGRSAFDPVFRAH